MADIYCVKCGEPWDAFYIRSDMEAPLGWPLPVDGDEAEEVIREKWATAPDNIIELAVALGRAEVAYINTRGLPDSHPTVTSALRASKEARDALGLAVYNTGLGRGCPGCWDDPSTIPTDEESQLENLRAAVFDGVWDGDPAELF